MTSLRQQTEQDGDRFAGYAPVLAAVAERVTTESNPGALVSEIKSGAASVTLQSVIDAILDREQKKLKLLTFEDTTLRDRLYLPMEQLDHLVARRYEMSKPVSVTAMSDNDRDVYERALETWVSEHPFLGGGTDTSPSAVFDAAITSHALGNADVAQSAVEREYRRRANPFLSVFYPRPRTNIYGSESIYLPAEHIGLVYNSVRARLSLAETASLLVTERGRVEDDDEAQKMEVEITILGSRQERQERTLLTFESAGTVPICLGPHLADAIIDVPHGHVKMGTGTEMALVAPIDIECKTLELNATKLIVEASPRESFAHAVMLTGQEADVAIAGSPVVRRNVQFCVSWPGCHGYPWHQFAVDSYKVDEQQVVDESRVREGLQRLRRLVTAFRARGRGKLARIRDKIESPRMMRGVGHAVLQAMIEDNIVYLEGMLYVLDASALGRVVGVTYVQCAKQQFPDRAIAFVDGVVRRAG